MSSNKLRSNVTGAQLDEYLGVIYVYILTNSANKVSGWSIAEVRLLAWKNMLLGNILFSNCNFNIIKHNDKADSHNLNISNLKRAVSRNYLELINRYSFSDKQAKEEETLRKDI